jgi:hypothetical protein
MRILGTIASSNFTVPKVNWTTLSTTAGTGRYLNGQDTWNMVARLSYIEGNVFAIMAGQNAGANTFGVWYNSDPANNLTGWTAVNPLGGTSAQACTFVSYNSSQGRWYWGGTTWVVTSTSLTGTKVNTSPNTTYEGNLGTTYSPMDIAHNGSRTVIVYRGWDGPGGGAFGTIWTTDNGIDFTNRIAYNSNRLNCVVYAGNAPGLGHTFVAGTADGFVRISYDNGNTWSNTASFPNEGYGFTDVVKLASNGAGTVIARLPYALYTSTNYGATWTKTYTDSPATSANYTRNAPTNAQPNSFPVSIEWDAANSRFVAMFGAVQLVSNSTGSTWTQNTTFSFANTGIFIGSAVYHAGLNYWVAAQCKSNSDAYSTGVAKVLAWTNNITGT